MFVKLPSSFSNWPDTKEKLESLIGNSTWKNFEEFLLDFIKQSNRRNSICEDENPFPLLKNLLREDPTFLTNVLPKVCRLALEMPILFPEGKLKILDKNSEDVLELTRKKVGCLLSHMFLCTVMPDQNLIKEGLMIGDIYSPINFRYLHSSHLNSGPPDAYLRTLLIYFKSIFEEDNTKLDTEKVIFQRLTFKGDDFDPSKVEAPIVKTEVHLDGRIGDLENHVEIDFSNLNVGFGRAGTQEELIIGMSPEMCVVVLFNHFLAEKDSILIQGAKIYGNYSGYGHSVKFLGPFTGSRDWTQRKILAMDAIPDPGSIADQVSDEIMKRELVKSFVAFSPAKGQIVDTGHWGCGVFGGDKGVKALVQLISASMAGISKLEFYSFGDELFYRQFLTCNELIRKNEINVGQLWNWIKEFEKEKETLGWERLGNKENILSWINSTIHRKK